MRKNNYPEKQRREAEEKKLNDIKLSRKFNKDCKNMIAKMKAFAEKDYIMEEI